MGSEYTLLMKVVNGCLWSFPVHDWLFSSLLPSTDQRQTNLIISELIQPVSRLSG